MKRLGRDAFTQGIPTAQGHRTTTAWLRSLLREPRDAKELAGGAAALHRPALEQAVLDGRADLRQADVINKACDAIPTNLAEIAEAGDVAEIVDHAETVMIDLAGRMPAYQLRRIGEQILTEVAPHLADQAHEAALNRRQARNHRKRGFTLGLPIDGLIRLSGRLGAEDAAIVQAALHPLCQPQPDDERTAPQRRADALVDLCRFTLRTTELPADGGEPPPMAVTLPYDTPTRAEGPASPTSANDSPPPAPAAWRVTPGSCPWSSMVKARSSTSAGPSAWPPGQSAAPRLSETAAAPSPCVIGRHAGPTATTS